MRTIIVRRLLWLTLLLAIMVSACTRSTPPGPNSVGGTLGDTAYTFLYWPEGLRLMIWYDGVQSAASSGSGSTEDPVHRQEGFAVTEDGRRITWRLETSDGQAATFAIEGQPFDLDRGKLFIIHADSDPVQIEQLERDLSVVETSNAGIEDFAAEDPDISPLLP